MQQANEFDFDKICFDSDQMQVLSLSRRKERFPLPLTKGPVNFSVVRSEGTFSNRWGVQVGASGDAYIYCRDNPTFEKVSLHASGRQHISFSPKVAYSIGAKSRFGNVWSEPEFESQAIATFTLLFPPWGVGFDLADVPKQSTKDEMLIIGHKEKLVVVGFFIADAGVDLRGRVSHIVLAQLPARTGKTLHVIAWKEPQKGLMETVQSAFPNATQTFAEEGLKDGDYEMHVQGYRSSNSAYMVAFPVHYTSAAGSGD